MDATNQKMEDLAQLVHMHAPADGLHQTSIPNVGVFRESAPHSATPRIYEPTIIVSAQGRKRVHLDGQSYEYNPGHFLTTLAPMPVECQVIEASIEKPLLGVCIGLDRHRMLQVLMKMDQTGRPPVRPHGIDPTGIFIAPMNPRLRDAVIRLLKTLEDACEAAIVGEAVIDEIYFRILRDERGGALTHLLQQRGQIQQIARAVEHVHQNLAQQVSVDELASLVNMSSSGFHQKFKEVMHLSPLQYAKRVKLNRAQFSREYKRHFGVAPSEDRP